MKENDLFILGAGFSKAFNNKMPTMNELTEEISEKIGEIYKNLYKEYIKGKFTDFEDIITYLYQDLPWKNETEKHLHKGLYYRITELLVKIIKDKEPKDDEIKISKDESDFFSKIHKENANIITFNYDTIFERYLIKATKNNGKLFMNYDRKELDYYDIYYHLPIMSLEARTSQIYDSKRRERKKGIPTVKISKLHGSVNWYYSGDARSGGELIYYEYDKISGNEFEREKNRRDLVPLIIPPVLDKSGFMGISAIKIQWEMARRAIQDADNIYILGYSFPLTDMAIKLLFKSSVKTGARIYIVDKRKVVFNNLKKVFKKIKGQERRKNNVKILDTYIANEDDIIIKFIKDYIYDKTKTF